MRIAWLGFAAFALLACGSDDSAYTSSTGSAGSSNTSAGTAGTSKSGAAGSTSSSSSGGSGGAAGSTGGEAGSSAGGTAGTGGSAGSGGDAGSGGAAGGGVDGGSRDASMGDTGMPKADAITPDGPSKARQIARPINMPYAKNGYWEYLPPGYGDGSKRPLLVFWHGVGEDGSGSATDLNKVLAHGPPKLINLNQWPSDRPYVVLSTQHVPPAGGQADCPSADEIHDFIALGMGRYDVDPNSVYLTGLSCGALGSSSYLGKYQGQQVVAAALIAGNASTAYNAAGCSLLNGVALWAFHGDADQTVPIGPDQMGMDKFKACPGVHKDALFDVIAGADHQRSWEVVYDLTAMKDIYTWMLAQHK